MEEDGWSEAQVNVEDEEVRTSEAHVRTSQAQACITQNTQAVQTPPSQLVFSVIDQEAEPSTLHRPVPQHSSTADPHLHHAILRYRDLKINNLLQHQQKLQKWQNHQSSVHRLP
ncbi:hypothetical protein GBA52_000490 [Prunus armeniaca]|nr:hypothetical protein GBA52_000490 [Prunus armeniaca]